MGGFSGIVTDWDSQAFRLTNRVSGVRHKKFTQEREARLFVEQHTATAAAEVVFIRHDQAEAGIPPGEQGGPAK